MGLWVHKFLNLHICLCISLLSLLFVSNPAEPHDADHYQSSWCSFWTLSNANIATCPLKGHFEHTVPILETHTVLSLLFNTAPAVTVCVIVAVCCSEKKKRKRIHPWAGSALYLVLLLRQSRSISNTCHSF